MKHLILTVRHAFQGTFAAVAVLVPCLAFADFALRDATVVYCDDYDKTPFVENYDRPFGAPAAKDLARILSLTTGAKVRAMTESTWNKDANNSTVHLLSRPTIFVGPCRATLGALGDRPLPDGALGDRPLPTAWNGFRIKVTENAAYIVGPTETAVSYGVTEFIERFCGYRFLAQNGENPYEVVPERTVGPCDFKMQPITELRAFYRGWINNWAKPEDMPLTSRNWWPYFRQRRLLQRQSDLPASLRVRLIDKSSCHLVYKYLPPKKYFGDHPEWYSMDESGRRTHIENGDCQLCYTNPAMRDEFTKNLLAMIAADKAANPTDYARIYDIGQGDNTSRLCLCPECRKVIAKYNAKKGGNWEGGDAGLQLEFANEIARRVRAVHPEIKLRIACYVSTAGVPKGIRADPNVVVEWNDVYSLCDHMRGLTDPLNRPHRDEYLGWMGTGAEMQVWDYMLYGTVPEVNAEALRDDMRFYRDHLPTSLFMESEFHHQPFYDLHEYLYDQLSYNPDADLDALIGAWCAVYGRAAEKMRTVIGRLMRLERENPPANHSLWHQRILPWYTRENFESLAADCTAAYRLEDRPFMRARVALVLAGIYGWLREHYAGIYGKDAELARCTELFARYEKEWATVENTDPAKRAATERRVDERLKARTVRFRDLPPGCADVPAADLKCLDSDSGQWRERKSNLITIESDPHSETGKAYVRRFPSGSKPPYPLTGGVFDIPLDKVLARFTLDESATRHDDVYRWYCLGTAQIGRNSYAWLTDDWRTQISFSGFYLNADGAQVDLNTYEIWVSLKFNEDWFAFDRVVLKRVSGGAGATK